ASTLRFGGARVPIAAASPKVKQALEIIPMKISAFCSALCFCIGVSVATGAAAKEDQPLPAAASSCQLHSATGDIHRIIHIQFDNTHFRRDNPNVPSDLEQMPHLLNFILGNGTLLTNDHTVLISHTAGGILSTLTGVYPDRHGQTVSNSYVRTASGSGFFSFPSSFGYWTDTV